MAARPSIEALCFDIFLHEKGMPYYDVAKWFQWEAEHFVNPASWEPLLGEREVWTALDRIATSLRDSLRRARLAAYPSCPTLHI